LVAAVALAELDAKEAVPHLIKFLKDGKRVPCCCGSALDQAIIKLGGKQVIPEIKELLKSQDITIRETSITILADLDAKEAIPDLIKLSESDEYNGVRGRAVTALAKLGTKEEMIPLFIRLFSNDSSSDVPWACSDILIESGGTEEIIKLSKFVDSDDEVKRELSIYIISGIIDNHLKNYLPIDEIAKLQENKSKYVRGLASIALIESCGEELLSKTSTDDIYAVIEYPKWDCNKDIKKRGQHALEMLDRNIRFKK
jgi:HEAT repeat protein